MDCFSLVMRLEARKQLTSIIIYLVLKYGFRWRKYLAEMAKFWDGPLADDSIFVSKRLLVYYSRKKIKEILSSLDLLDGHPFYNRDFLQGVIDAVAIPDSGGLRFIFHSRDDLKEFLESDEGFGIKFDKENLDGKYKYRHRTPYLPILATQCKGELDSYLTGALSASDPFIDENGELWCRVKKKCYKNFKRLAVNFKQDGDHFLVSPFYIMLFNGELPEYVYFKWMNILDKANSNSLKTASFDALIHWRYVFGKKVFDSGMLPFLRSRASYWKYMSVELKSIKSIMQERRIDFIDTRIVVRCKRWFEMYKNSKDILKKVVQ